MLPHFININRSMNGSVDNYVHPYEIVFLINDNTWFLKTCKKIQFVDDCKNILMKYDFNINDASALASYEALFGCYTSRHFLEMQIMQYAKIGTLLKTCKIYGCKVKSISDVYSICNTAKEWPKVMLRIEYLEKNEIEN